MLPPLPPGDLPATVILLTATACYALFHLGATTPARKRLLGVLLLGLAPLLVATLALGRAPAALGLTLLNPGDSLLVTAATLAVLLPGVYRQSRRPWFHEPYPEVRRPVWTPRDLAANAATWAAYLAAYELFFRGVLLFTLADHLGPWPAIATVTALYVAVHLPKNPAEYLGALPMGLLLAWTALWTGSLLAPFAIHLALALTTDTLAIAANPAMRFARRDDAVSR